MISLQEPIMGESLQTYEELSINAVLPQQQPQLEEPQEEMEVDEGTSMKSKNTMKTMFRTLRNDMSSINTLIQDSLGMAGLKIHKCNQPDERIGVEQVRKAPLYSLRNLILPTFPLVFSYNSGNLSLIKSILKYNIIIVDRK